MPEDIIQPQDEPFQAINIILLVFGIIFSLIGIGGTVYSFKVTKEMGPKMDEQFKRICDDKRNYPRCVASAAESGYKIITPWKEYFTRDETPFVTESTVP